MKFDMIIFNPPYLPEDVRLKDITLDGGKKGYELLERFFSQANNYLNKNGKILIVFSSLTKKERVDEIIMKNNFTSTLLEKKRIFFEDLYVYLVEKEKTPKIKGITKLTFFTKGKRGLLYTGLYKNKKVVVKTKLPESRAIARIEIEAQWLKSLNKHNIGPKFLFSTKDCIVYEFVEGVFLPEFIEKTIKKSIILALKRILDQCFILDKLNINKEEMHNPYKHIIITKDKKAVLIDFERANYSKKPKNVTQFCQYLTSGTMSVLLKRKGIKIDKKKIIELAKEYKNKQNLTNFNKIIKIR
jgi:predicted Ser/Thr protein kinase